MRNYLVLSAFDMLSLPEAGRRAAKTWVEWSEVGGDDAVARALLAGEWRS